MRGVRRKVKLTNWIIFVGIIISGAALFSAIGISSVANEEHWIRENIVPFLTGFGVIFGWIFTVAGIVNAVFGVIFRISGRLPSFWKSLYPVNFCLSISAALIVSEGHVF